MKSYLSILILLITVNFANTQENQDLPYSTINIVRSGNFFGSACRTDILFRNQRQFNLKLNSVVKYKIYSVGKIAITLERNCPATQSVPASSSSDQLEIEVERGKEYFLFYNAGSFTEVDQAKVQRFLDKPKNLMNQEENLENPISRSSINDLAKKDGKGQGTCFLISEEGYMITNYHIIQYAKEITITGIKGDFSTRYGAILIASDPSNDLALIKIINKNVKFSPIPFSIRSSGVEQAEKVYALGFPKAEAMGQEVKINDGIISSKSGVKGDISKFQISAVVNPGNSGGPLFDENGNLIGVIYAKSTIAEAAGYAIKASYLEAFLKNVDSFVFPTYLNTIQDKTLPQKISVLKDFIYIIETN